jgi:hypothetical protein
MFSALFSWRYFIVHATETEYVTHVRAEADNLCNLLSKWIFSGINDRLN